MGSWLTLILTGMGSGSGTGAKPKPGGDRRAAAISSLTNFFASSSWAPQWTCCEMIEMLRTMAKIKDLICLDECILSWLLFIGLL